MTESAKRPLKKSPLGTRNSTLYRLVGAWIYDGLSEEEIYENADAINRQNFHHPLSIKEVRRVVASILDLGQQKG
jgi:hypothetical protein